jgi:hypothetical protein
VPGILSEYDELRLRIERGEGGTHHVVATSSVGEAAGLFELPFSELEVENFILRVSHSRGRRRINSTTTGEAKQFGGQLFEAMFRADIRDLFREALANARAEDHGLRVTLCLSGAPELMDVPWEYLYDEPNFLSVSAFTPVIRYLDLPRSYRPLRVCPPLRILAMVSSPSDYPPLDAERERTNMEGAVRGLTEKGAVEIDWIEDSTLSSLLRRLQSDTYHVFHYIGHGAYDEQAEQGQLLFEDQNNLGSPVSGDKLAMLLNDFTSLRLAVLNACEGARTSRADPFSGVAASLVRRNIPAVIAMQFEITDVAAVVFAEGFYRALATGCPVDASLAAARLAMFAERSDEIEWGTPVLFMRVMDGRIFEVPESAVPAIEPVASEAPVEHEVPVEHEAPVAPEPPDAAEPPAASQPPVSSEPSPARNGGRHARLLKLGAAVVSLAAVVAVVLAVTLGGGKGGTPGPTRESPKDVVAAFFTAYNDGDNGAAADLWAPAVNNAATYRPGFPPNAGLQHLTTVDKVKSSVLSHGCQRSVTSTTVAGNVVTVIYWSVGHRPGQVKCTAGNQLWKDVLTVADGHITSDISTRVS